MTFNFFFKKYISFVLSQYKNKAHCTYCSIGKFFCLFKWLLLLLKQCSTVSCHGPWLSTVDVGLCIDSVWKVISGCGVWFVGWLYYIGHGWVNNSSCSSTWPVIPVVPNVYHCSHQVLSPTVPSLANGSTRNGWISPFMWSARDTKKQQSFRVFSGDETVWVRSKDARVSGAMLTVLKGLNWSQDKADGINVGGNLLYGCIQFYLCQEVNWFVIIYFWYAFFFIIRCLMKCVQMGFRAPVSL